MRRTLMGLLTVALVVQASAAYAYNDAGSDPQDAGGGFLDIRSSVRRVWTGPDGRRWLTIKFTSYGPYQYLWRVRVLLDSRGGPHYDYRMTMWEFDSSGRGCNVHNRPGQPGKWVHGKYYGTDFKYWATCRVPLWAVHPTKRIRWRLVSISEGGNEPRFIDYAPNSINFYR